MKRINPFLYFLVLLFVDCSEFNKSEKQIDLTGNALESLVSAAANGNKIANDSLSGLIDLSMPENYLYNQPNIDSFHLDSVKYFSVSIIHPNSAYNRFAVYDEESNCYLIDKSLNGKFSFKLFEIDNTKFLKIVENFTSLDSIRVVRLSLYRKIEDSFNLVFRNYAEVKTKENVYNQVITSITLDTIKTKLFIPKNNKVKSYKDYFVYSQSLKDYQSELSLFDSLIYKEITNLAENSPD